MQGAIEVATLQDAEAVTRLLGACYGELMRPAYEAAVLQAALPAMTRANPMLLSSGTYYIVRGPDDAVIGCGGWTPERPGTILSEPGIAHIRHFAVHPARVGCGIGRSLYRRCEADAAAAGTATFEVFSSLNAVPFYAAMGFRAHEHVTVAMGQGIDFPSVRMRRTI